MRVNVYPGHPSAGTPVIASRTSNPGTVSIATVAARAGVSIATVSRVVNGIANKASTDTAARVWAAVRALGWEGRYLVIGFAAGEIPKLPLNLVLLKSCDIRGVLWGAWTMREPQAQQALMTDIVRSCAEGKLSAHVHAAYPLAEITTALAAISDRKVMGKIVLRP